MPSGLGHALGGAIVGLLGGRGRDSARTGQGQSHSWRELALLAAVACAPDLDFFWGRHAAETHSIGAAALGGLVVLAVSKGSQVRLAVCVALAWSSHVVFDWLGSDDTPPIGVMALWPFTDAYYFAHAYVFDAISRRYWLPNFWPHNLMAVAKEAAILGPIVAALAWWRFGKVRGRAGRFGKVREGSGKFK